VRTVTADSPEGEQWLVRVAWLPRWRFLARRFGGWRRRRSDNKPAGKKSGGGGGGWGGLPDLGGGSGDDILVVIAIIVGFILFGLLFWFLLLPLLLLIFDLLAVVVLCVLAAAARVLFRRPWTVEAVAGERRFTVAVVGWRAALRARDEIAEKLRLGYPEAAVVAAVGPTGAVQSR
jgi:hypothetical protein